jgi:hypothetical protein
MKIDPKVRSTFHRMMLKRLSRSLPEIAQSLSIIEPEPHAILRIGFGAGGELTRHPWYVIAILLDYKERSLMRFGELNLMTSLNRFGSKYKVRGSVFWSWPLRVKYETGMLTFPFSPVDAKAFDEHLLKMQAVFVSVAKRSLKNAA